MKAFGLAAALIAVASSPAQAQQAPLSDEQIEFYAEVLAMGFACTDVREFNIRHEALGDWVTERLSTQPEAELEAVLALRDSKIVAMQEETAQVRDMPRGNEQEDAMLEHYSRAVQRCDRMARHSLAGDYFIRR